MPVERKVTAASAASAVAGIVLWALGRWVFKGGVPAEVASFIVFAAAPGLVAFGAGYLARHTPRPDLAPPATPPAAARAVPPALPTTLYRPPEQPGTGPEGMP